MSIVAKMAPVSVIKIEEQQPVTFVISYKDNIISQFGNSNQLLYFMMSSDIPFWDTVKCHIQAKIKEQPSLLEAKKIKSCT